MLTMSSKVGDGGGRRISVREILCKKDSATFAGSEDEGGGHKPRNVSSL